jgi:hypothetical protein
MTFKRSNKLTRGLLHAAHHSLRIGDTVKPQLALSKTPRSAGLIRRFSDFPKMMSILYLILAFPGSFAQTAPSQEGDSKPGVLVARSPTAHRSATQFGVENTVWRSKDKGMNSFLKVAAGPECFNHANSLAVLQGNRVKVVLEIPNLPISSTTTASTANSSTVNSGTTNSSPTNSNPANSSPANSSPAKGASAAKTTSAIKVSQSFRLVAFICPQEDSASITRVTIDATMPEHQHGMNYKPKTQLELGLGEQGSGTRRLTAEGMVFHMPGKWQIELQVFGKDRDNQPWPSPERLRYDYILN